MEPSPAASRIRPVVDGVWLVAFGASLLWLLLGPSGASRPAGLLLELRPGLQQQSLLRHGKRVGTVQLLTLRQEKGWILERRIRIGGEDAAVVRQQLRSDLSLAHLSLQVTLDRLGELAGIPGSLIGELGGLGALRLSGSCRLETGSCLLVGQLGSRALRLPIQPGRGPVLAAAVYPLLARGRLGRSIELSMFDPLGLQPHRVVLRVEGKDTLELAGGRRTAVRVRTDADGLGAYVWLDAEGMPLREDLPFGFRTEHEWWRSHE